ncbi:response regulator transcription factor [Roseibacillus persicicus]|uniref:DNA-binding response regulator n=1 Tax=Roseibacillus persicicus TaxID=454148 RepID=A0A918TD45_9BACT|nr:response regulator transcription factor [Roseibacillus persicicus]GHC42131.1 DNA-binding response regulator [Roseibacillus persicicus]
MSDSSPVQVRAVTNTFDVLVLENSKEERSGGGFYVFLFPLMVMSSVRVKILVVEDDEDLRALLVSMLRDEGYVVDSCSDGEEGFYRAANWDYDAIVLDVMLEGLDGFEVLRRLRAVKKIPVLMLTARDAVSDRVRGLDEGADDYLTKPFDHPEFLARVRAVIRRGGLSLERQLTLGPVELDTMAMRVTVDGKPVELTAREFALAEMLMRRRGEVVSRDFIYENLFDEDDESLSNMLDVYVYKLRQKLGRDFVKTRRGAGYVAE